MTGVVELQITQFSLIYLLLIVVTLLLKRSGLSQSREILLGSLRMTVQLVIAGLVLSHLMTQEHPWLTSLYLLTMLVFCIHRVLQKNAQLNTHFKCIIAGSLALSGLFLLSFFMLVIVGESLLNPQYAIPIGGMILGNSMTGIILGLNHFTSTIGLQKLEIETLENLGVHPDKILVGAVNSSIEAALIPTINSMVGMGIIFLPGMMTGQILSGTSPMTAIMYQIAIMVAICTGVCLTVYCSLKFGYKTLYSENLLVDFRRL